MGGIYYNFLYIKVDSKICFLHSELAVLNQVWILGVTSLLFPCSCILTMFQVPDVSQALCVCRLCNLRDNSIPLRYVLSYLMATWGVDEQYILLQHWHENFRPYLHPVQLSTTILWFPEGSLYAANQKTIQPIKKKYMWFSALCNV